MSKLLGFCSAACLVFALAACGGGDGGYSTGGGSAGSGCAAAQENQQILGVMQQWYYWYQYLPSLDPSQYSTPQAFVAAESYKPLDRFSFVTSQSANAAFYGQGNYVGMGFVQTLDSAKDAFVLEQVFPGSPAAKAGLARGDRITSVDGTSIAALNASGQLATAFGDATIGLQVTLGYTDMGGNPHTVTLTKAVVTEPSVSLAKVIDDGGIKVGYFLFGNFIDVTDGELDKAFTMFRIQGVQELVIDERYNGGGEVVVAQYLASLISMPATSGKTFITLQYNNKQRGNDHTYQFRPTSVKPLGLTRVVFITTGGSASSSEMIINALKPHIDVVTVGATTFGKPVGENGFDVCADVLFPMTFKMVNSAGYGDYFSGLAPTCKAPDDTAHALGDSTEKSLTQALYYILNTACDPAITARTEELLTAAPPPEPKAYGWQQLINAY